jgi:hypothetical protein
MSKFLTYRNLYLESHKNLETVIKDERKAIERYDTLNKVKSAIELERNNLQTLLSEGTEKEKLLENELLNAEKSISQLTDSLKIKDEFISHYKNFITYYKDEKKINGRWTFTYQNTSMDLNFEETLYIIDNVIHRVDGGQTQSTYLIKFFLYDAPQNKIILHLSFIPNIFESNYISTSIINKDTFDDTSPDRFNLNARVLTNITLIQELEVKSDNLLIGTENEKALIQYKRL